MRTLCLCLQRDTSPSVAENFLTFSPRVHYRAPGLVFMDITGTAKMFGGEKKLLEEALHVSREFFSDATAAISDTPWGAQALAAEKPGAISQPTRELVDLETAPLSRLHQLEGLIAWRSNSEVEDIVDFFHMLGIHRLGEIRRFQVDSFRERWKETGTLIWKRMNGLDKQVISPLLPTEALQDYVHLDFPVSLMPFLLHCLERSLRRLMARLQGRGEFAQKIIVQLFCEYSGAVHVIELEPASPGRNLELFMKLLENKLSEVSLDNPIQQMEIEVIPCPERIQQLSFFEPRVSDQEKLSQLVSVFNQASLTTGFLKPRDEVLPEEAWEVTNEFEEYLPIEDAVEVEGQSFQIRPAYGFSLCQAPRPSRLLKKPRALGRGELDRYQFLSHQPIERLEDSWWENSRGRDYYFALSAKGEFVWLFFDRIESQYYLHGYFD
jgi:protein ImuB